MDAFRNPIHSFQGGSNYQGMQHNYIFPGIQPSHQSYPLVQNVSQNAPLIIPNSYHISNLNGSSQITLTGLNGPVNVLPCFNQNTNFMPFMINNTNSVSYNYNGGMLPIENSQPSLVNIIPQNQILQIQKINTVTSVTNKSEVKNHKTENVGKTSKKGTDINVKRRLKETNKSRKAICAREKIGNISMDITPAFPIQNIPIRKILDLNIMGCSFEIKNLNINLHDKVTCKTKFLDALKQVIGNKTLFYWFILKCEEKQISVFQNNVYIELYSVDDFQTLFEVIDEESCLPLPFITKGVGNKKKYFYINLTKGSNDKVRKLNGLIFYNIDEKKRIMCRYPGIKLHCTFSENIKDITIHIHESAMSAYQSSMAHIRELIICKHVTWGFLQAWIRRVTKHYKDFFTAEQISKNLTLQQKETRDGKILPENESGPIYFIGYSNFYLKFDPVNSKQARISFSVDNFETKFVCDVTVVQYYRQFFLLNDIHSMHVLNYVVLFFGKKSGRIKVRNEQNSNRNKSLQKGEKQLTIPTMTQKIQIVFSQCDKSRIEPTPDSSESSFSGTGTNKGETSGTYFSWHLSSRAENSVNNQQSENSVKPKEQIIVCPLQKPLVKPLLKTRTVEEINSSVEANKRLGFYPINFDSIGKFDVKTDKSNQLKQQKFVTLIQEALQNSYSMNTFEITNVDETNDENVISQRFKEALDRAMDSKSLESFIGTIYVNLKLHFTNSTSRKILNTMIERAIEKKYHDFKNLIVESQFTDQIYVNKPSTEYQPRLLEMIMGALATEKSFNEPTPNTKMESENSRVPLNSPVQVPPQEENLQSLLPGKVILKEQMIGTSVEPSLSKPTENLKSNNNSEIRSEESEPCSLLNKINVEETEPTSLEKNVLPPSKNDNSLAINTNDKNIGFVCKIEDLDCLTNIDNGEKNNEEGSTIPVGSENSEHLESIKGEPENDPNLDAQESETYRPDSKQLSVKLNVHDGSKFIVKCDVEEKDDRSAPGILDSLQLITEMNENASVETKCEPRKKKRKRNDSDGENNIIRAKALERLRKRSGIVEDFSVKTMRKEKLNEAEIVKNSEKKFGECEETKENNFFFGNRFKRELKILLRRLEDIPEYKKYFENNRSDLQFKVKKVKFKNKDRLESFKIIGVKKLAKQCSQLKRKSNVK